MDTCLKISGILFLEFVSIFAALPSIHVRENVSHRDQILLENNLGVTETKTLLRCANRCIMTEFCMSMFYRAQTNQCVLHKFLSAYLDLQQTMTTVSNGWKYYEKIDGFGVAGRGMQCLKSGFLYDSSMDVCYLMKSASYNFDSIIQECTNMNSTLIKITSQAKQNWVIGIIGSNTESMVCIQGNNDNVDDEYRFNDGQPMTYFNWNNGENQPDGGSEHYIIMRRIYNYLWHDADKVYPTMRCLIICEK